MPDALKEKQKSLKRRRLIQEDNDSDSDGDDLPLHAALSDEPPLPPAKPNNLQLKKTSLSKSSTTSSQPAAKVLSKSSATSSSSQQTTTPASVTPKVAAAKPKPSTSSQSAPKAAGSTVVDLTASKATRESSTTDFPVDFSLLKQEVITKGLTLAKEFPEDDLSIKQGDLVVYCEGIYQEDHRAALVLAHMSVDTVRLRFQLFPAHTFSFEGDHLELPSCLCVKACAYPLHIGRRFHFFGPPPRTRSINHPFAIRCIDNGGTEKNLLGIDNIDTGFEFLSSRPLPSSAEAILIQGIVIGFLGSSLDKYDFRLTAFLRTSDEKLEDLWDDDKVAYRVCCCSVSEFFSYINSTPARGTLSENSIGFLTSTKDPRMITINLAMTFIHNQLCNSRSWKPKGIVKLTQDLIAARLSSPRSRKVPAKAAAPAVTTSSSTSTSAVVTPAPSSSVTKLKEELQAKKVTVILVTLVYISFMLASSTCPRAFQDNLAAAKSTIKDLEKQVGLLSRQVSQLTQSYKEAQATTSSLLGKVSELQKEKQTLGAALRTAQSDLNQAKQDLSHAQASSKPLARSSPDPMTWFMNYPDDPPATTSSPQADSRLLPGDLQHQSKRTITSLSPPTTRHSFAQMIEELVDKRMSSAMSTTSSASGPGQAPPTLSPSAVPASQAPPLMSYPSYGGYPMGYGVMPFQHFPFHNLAQASSQLQGQAPGPSPMPQAAFQAPAPGPSGVFPGQPGKTLSSVSSMTPPVQPPQPQPAISPELLALLQQANLLAQAQGLTSQGTSAVLPSPPSSVPAPAPSPAPVPAPAPAPVPPPTSAPAFSPSTTAGPSAPTPQPFAGADPELLAQFYMFLQGSRK